MSFLQHRVRVMTWNEERITRSPWLHRTAWFYNLSSSSSVSQSHHPTRPCYGDSLCFWALTCRINSVANSWEARQEMTWRASEERFNGSTSMFSSCHSSSIQEKKRICLLSLSTFDIVLLLLASPLHHTRNNK